MCASCSIIVADLSGTNMTWLVTADLFVGALTAAQVLSRHGV